MKRLTISLLACLVLVAAHAQTAVNYPNDVKTVLETIKTNAFKNGYQHMISYDETSNASLFVKQNTEYIVFFVYDNTSRPTPDFKGYLMTPDNELKKKYTAKPDDIGQVGAARVARLNFKTRKFADGHEQYPIKLEANPKATIYIFYRG
ncbi:hypothetical protein [Flavihumibacter solisilvae]|uniref:Uncharacterized protein n=1 Tax=Flavihumibacter solisilvae TaxID=1349421 RepID=A0A0C1IQR1_9BACT|nr:hypothetical protein [Flavihumibacter solisilvae]KIC92814.1 hypothetical protein OI18_20530 [Flavihumibacter solisilvae]